MGLKVKIKITHLEWLLFGEEVGTDISQNDNRHVGGQKYITKKNTRVNIKISHTDDRFTVIGLTDASANTVTCIIIFMGEELSFEQRMGHDIISTYDKLKSVTEYSEL